jgi:NRAMP (natural resistance-associated macrophage protein)-like metal ion transporter
MCCRRFPFDGWARSLAPAFRALGPGFITGASDSDPASIGTCAKVGASLGFAPLWLVVLSYPLMTAVQFSAAKLAMVSGAGLAGVLRRYYPPALLYPAVVALVVANTLNAAADLGAIAAALNLLVSIPTSVLIVPVAFGIVVMQVWGSYRVIVSMFRWLSLTLVAYAGPAFLARPDVGDVLKATFIPTLRLDSTTLLMLVAILGTTISPYLFFWQASQEVEEEISVGRETLVERRGATDAELGYALRDTGSGMFAANLVMYVVIVASGATLYEAGRTNIQSAAELAAVFRPLVGDSAGLLLAVGLIGTGLLAVPVLTGSAAYAVAEAFDWRTGLHEPPERALPFYGVIVLSTVFALVLNFTGVNLIDALFWTSVINGLLAPPLLVLLLLAANNPEVMGKQTNGALSNGLGWAATVAMFAAAGGLVLTWNASS